MSEEICCALCGEKMKNEEWTWGGEDAHKKCVLDEAKYVCAKCGNWYDISKNGECGECGSSKWKTLTRYDKYKILNKPNL